MNRFIIFLIGIGLILIACDRKSSLHAKNIQESMKEGYMIKELPMPVIPDSIKDSDNKRKYAGVHYWDTLNFKDTVLSLNDAFMEQSFANFTVILHAQPNETSLKNAYEKMLEKASVEPKALLKLKNIIKLYLGNPNSPMRSEDLWIPYLEVITADNRYADENENLRNELELELIKKNRPGMLAKDFNYITKEGSVRTLHTSPVGSEGIILIFYDPDCNHCKEIISLLKENPQISQWIESNKYKVLAVDVAEDYELWEKTYSDMPSEWSVGFNTDSIEEEDLYYFPALPVIYILDRNYIVKEKDVQI